MARSHRYATPAICIRTVPFGETSQVVQLATPEHGMVAALAKGAHRPGPELQGGLALASVGTAHLVRRPRAELDLLARFRIEEDLRGLAQDLERFYAASYVVDLLRAWMKPALPNPALFGAAHTAFRALAHAPRESIAGWVVWFEARALAATGHRPMLEACASCEGEIGGDAVFAAAAGGVVHAECAPPGPSRRIDAVELADLLRLYTARVPELKRNPPHARAVRTARAVHDIFVPYVLERRPHAMGPLPGRAVTRR